MGRSQAAIGAQGELPIPCSTEAKGWTQTPHIVTPPREQHTCPFNGSPINPEETDHCCLSDLVHQNGEDRQLHEGREGRSSTEQCGSSTMTAIQQKGEDGN
jgi:hypothetical protein